MCAVLLWVLDRAFGPFDAFGGGGRRMAKKDVLKKASLPELELEYAHLLC